LLLLLLPLLLQLGGELGLGKLHPQLVATPLAAIVLQERGKCSYTQRRCCRVLLAQM
jgi:hypothetical protein